MPSLSRHPDWPCEAVRAIRAEAVRAGAGRLLLRYRLTRGPGELVVLPPAAAARTDGLWKHTCFEAFVRPADADTYFEVNLAPSGQWAAYRFTAYREGMAELDIPAPVLEWRDAADPLELSASLDLSAVPELASGPWQVSLTAVIEEAHGRTSYWALAHPPTKPDFHHRAGFALTLPEPDA